MAKAIAEMNTYDAVNHPRHYTQHPSGVECIQVAEHFNFNLGNALKYIWRAGLKDDIIQDLEKAAWYLNREIQRRKGEGTGPHSSAGRPLFADESNRESSELARFPDASNGPGGAVGNPRIRQRCRPNHRPGVSADMAIVSGDAPGVKPPGRARDVG